MADQAGSGNLGMAERVASVGAGLALAAVAARPRPNVLLSVLALGAGVALAYRGATGHCGVKAMLEGGGEAGRLERPRDA